MGLALTNNSIDRYFRFLTKLDIVSKKKLIVKLTESIEVGEETEKNISGLFGAWDDSKSSEEIIKNIRESRKEKSDNIEF